MPVKVNDNRKPNNNTNSHGDSGHQCLIQSHSKTSPCCHLDSILARNNLHVHCLLLVPNGNVLQQLWDWRVIYSTIQNDAQTACPCQFSDMFPSPSFLRRHLVHHILREAILPGEHHPKQRHVGLVQMACWESGWETNQSHISRGLTLSSHHIHHGSTGLNGWNPTQPPGWWLTYPSEKY